MLFKFIRKSVDAALNQIMNQLKSVQDQVESPISNLVSVIMGGAWEGDDADAMSNEINNVVMPMVADLIAAIGGMTTGISQAADLIEEADSKAKGVVEDLVGVFGSIF
jgi:uncharacterized protein YukE